MPKWTCWLPFFSEKDTKFSLREWKDTNAQKYKVDKMEQNVRIVTKDTKDKEQLRKKHKSPPIPVQLLDGITHEAFRKRTSRRKHIMKKTSDGLNRSTL